MSIPSWLWVLVAVLIVLGILYLIGIHLHVTAG